MNFDCQVLQILTHVPHVSGNNLFIFVNFPELSDDVLLVVDDDIHFGYKYHANRPNADGILGINFVKLEQLYLVQEFFPF